MKLGDWIQSNLFAILCGGLCLYSGYVTGMNDQKNQISQLARDQLVANEAAKRLERVNRCLLFHITRLETGHTGQVPNCDP